MTLQPFSANFSKILECNFSWEAQYLVRLDSAKSKLGERAGGR